MIEQELVLDASAFLRATVDGDERAKVLIADASAVVIPPIFDLEVVNFVRRLERRGLMTGTRVTRIGVELESWSFVRVPIDHLLMRIISMRHNVTPYDASYVVVASDLNLPLVTADARLARAAEGLCPVELL